MSTLRKIKKAQAKEGTFGEWVRRAREILGGSQAELAGRLGVSVKTIKHWEADRAGSVKTKHLVKLQGVLQLGIESIVNNSKIDLSHYPKDKMPPDLQEQIAAITQEAEEVNKAFDALDALPDARWGNNRFVDLLKRTLENQLFYLSFLHELDTLESL